MGSRQADKLRPHGAKIDLFKGWQARMEWEHYNAKGGLDRNIFSARFEYRF